MLKTKKLFAICLIICLLVFSFALTSCGEKEFKLDKSTATVEVGDTVSVKAEYGKKLLSGDALTWTLDKEGIVTVEEGEEGDYVITAAAKGTVVVTFSYAKQSKEANITITVNDTAGDLAAAKTLKTAALNTLLATYTQTNYSTANWTTLSGYINTAKSTVTNATTIAAVNAVNVTSVKTQCDAVETIAQTTAKELAAAKLAKKGELDDLLAEYDEDDYSETNWEAMEQIIADAKTAVDDCDTIAAVDLILVADVETLCDAVEKIKFTVTFISEGETFTIQQVYINGKATLPAEPTKENYTFVGWFLGEAETPYNFNTSVTANINLTAVFSNYRITLKVGANDVTYYVNSQSGNDDEGTGSYISPFKTLGQAIREAAKAGDNNTQLKVEQSAVSNAWTEIDSGTVVKSFTTLKNLGTNGGKAFIGGTFDITSTVTVVAGKTLSVDFCGFTLSSSIATGEDADSRIFSVSGIAIFDDSTAYLSETNVAGARQVKNEQNQTLYYVSGGLVNVGPTSNYGIYVNGSSSPANPRGEVHINNGVFIATYVALYLNGYTSADSTINYAYLSDSNGTAAIYVWNGASIGEINGGYFTSDYYYSMVTGRDWDNEAVSSIGEINGGYFVKEVIIEDSEIDLISGGYYANIDAFWGVTFRNSTIGEISGGHFQLVADFFFSTMFIDKSSVNITNAYIYSSAAFYGAIFVNESSLTITNAYVYNESGAAISISENSSVNISGGEFIGTGSGVIDNGGTVTISGGKFTNSEVEGTGYALYASGTFTLSGGLFKSSGTTAICNNPDYMLFVTGYAMSSLPDGEGYYICYTIIEKLADEKVIKIAALTTLQGTYTQANYSEVNWNTLTGLITTAKTNIAAAGTIEAVYTIYDNAVSDCAAVKTIEQEELDAAKLTKKNALDAIIAGENADYDEDDYSEAKWVEMEEIIDDAKTAVDQLATKAEVLAYDINPIKVLCKSVDTKTRSEKIIITDGSGNAVFVYFVDESGNDNNDGSIYSSFKTFGKTVRAAAEKGTDGYTLTVFSMTEGAWTEIDSGTVVKSLATLQGLGTNGGKAFIGGTFDITSTVTVVAGKTLSVDFCGFTLTSNIITSEASIFSVSGIAIFDDCTAYLSETLVAGARQVKNEQNQTLYYVSGGVTSTKTDNGIYVNGPASPITPTGEVHINNGVFIAQNVALYLNGYTSPDSTINYAYLVGGEAAIYVWNGASIDEINGGYFTSDYFYSMLIKKDSDEEGDSYIKEINGGYFSSKYGSALDGNNVHIGSISGGYFLAAADSWEFAVYLRSSTIGLISGGTFITTDDYYSIGMYDSSISEISGGTLKGYYGGLYLDEISTVELISGGHFEGEVASAIQIYNGSSIISITDAYVYNATTSAIYVDDSSSLNISGGEFYGMDCGVIENEGTVTISGGQFTVIDTGSCDNALVTYSTGIFTLSGGRFKSWEGADICDDPDYMLFVTGYAMSSLPKEEGYYICHTIAEKLIDEKAIKIAALTTLQGTYTEGEYSEANWATLTGLISTAKTNIAAAETIASVNEIYDNAVSDCAAVKTIEQEELDAAKTAKKGALTTLQGTYTQGNYSGANWTILTGHITTAKNAVDACDTIVAVDLITVASVEALCDGVETDALNAAKLVKTSALDALLDGYTEVGYPEKWEALNGIIDDAKDEVEALTKIEDVTNYNVDAVAARLVAELTVNIGSLVDLTSAIDIANQFDGQIWVITEDISSIDIQVAIYKRTVLNGNNHILTFLDADTVGINGARSGIVIVADGVIVKNLTVNRGKTDSTWKSDYTLQVFDAKNVILENLTLTNGVAGLNVNGSSVTVNGALNVSGNYFGGIEVGKGSNSQSEITGSLIFAEGSTLVNTTEAYNAPAIWIDTNGKGSFGGITLTEKTVNGQKYYFTTTVALKFDKITALNNLLLNEDNYSEDNWEIVEGIIEDAITAIDGATPAQVLNLYQGAISAYNDVETLTQTAARLLAEAKVAKKGELDALLEPYNEDDYPEKWAALNGIIDDAKDEVEALTKIDDVTNYDVDAVAAQLVAELTVNIGSLVDLTSAIDIANQFDGQIWVITANISSIDIQVAIYKRTVLEGKGFTLTFVDTEAVGIPNARSGIVILADKTLVKDLKVNRGKTAKTWNSAFALQVFDAKDVTLENLILTKGVAGLMVNGSSVTVKGTLDVSDNYYGGIEVGKGSNSQSEINGSLIFAEGSTLVNTTEAYNAPAIWIDTNGKGSFEGITTLTERTVNGQKHYFTTTVLLKFDKITALNNLLLNEDNYDEDNWEIVEGIIEGAITAINGASTPLQVLNLYQDAIIAYNAVHALRKYVSTFEDLTNAIETADTVIFLNDITVPIDAANTNREITINAYTRDYDLVIDLNNKTLNGRISVRNVKISPYTQYPYSATITVQNGTVASPTDYGIVVIGNGDVDVTLTDLTVSALEVGLGTNGLTQGAKITINGGSYTGLHLGAYLTGNYTYNFNEATFTGASAIHIKSGTLTLTDCDLTADGEYAAPVYDGGTYKLTGDGLMVEPTVGYFQTLVVTINGGSITSENGYAIEEYASANEGVTPVAYATITVDGECVLDGELGAVLSQNNKITALVSSADEFTAAAGYANNILIKVMQSITVGEGEYLFEEGALILNNSSVVLTISENAKLRVYRIQLNSGKVINNGEVELVRGAIGGHSPTLFVNNGTITSYVNTANAITTAISYSNKIVLIADIPASYTVSMSTATKLFTIDLNGYSFLGGFVVSNNYNRNGNFNITLMDSSEDKTGIIGSADIDYGIELYGSAGTMTLNLNGVTVKGKYGGLYSNGSYFSQFYTVTGNKVTFEGSLSDNNLGAYLAANYTYNFTECEFVGVSGIHIKSGTLTLTDCDLIANGAYAEPKYHGNGANLTGNGLMVEPTVGYFQTLVVTINGGTITSENGYAIEEYASANEGVTPVAYATIAIDGECVLTGELGTILSQNNKITFEGFTFVTDTEAHTITITGYNGTGGEVFIPSSIYGNIVTAIGAQAFMFNEDITTISIPASITSIGTKAFYNCLNLEGIIFGESSNLTTIGERAFEACALTNIDIPDSVVSIGDGAFAACPFASIVIPDSVVSIGEGAFADCPFESIVIPSGVTTLGEGVFGLCENLTSVTIGAGVTVDEMAFFYFDGENFNDRGFKDAYDDETGGAGTYVIVDNAWVKSI